VDSGTLKTAITPENAAAAANQPEVLNKSVLYPSLTSSKSFSIFLLESSVFVESVCSSSSDRSQYLRASNDAK
jgi:hypothetical protein